MNYQRLFKVSLHIRLDEEPYGLNWEIEVAHFTNYRLCRKTECCKPRRNQKKKKGNKKKRMHIRDIFCCLYLENIFPDITEVCTII